MNILQYSTWEERCGIAGYTGNLVTALTELGASVEVHAVNTRERKYKPRAEVRRELEAVCVRARTFDVVHIQHEFSFFDRYDLRHSVRNFSQVLKRLRRQNTPVVVTFHSHPPFRSGLVDVIEAHRGELGRRLRELLGFRNVLLARQWRKQVGREFTPRRRCRALVHTKTTRRVLIQEGGFAEDSISVIPMGVVNRSPHSMPTPHYAKEVLGYDADDTVLSIFGFVQLFKGYEVALEALKLLPERYKLAIVGGPHPERGPDRTMDVVLRLRAKFDLEDRVRVTGFVDFETLDLYHAATDVCVAPYRHGDLISGSAAMTWALSSGKPVVASNIPAFVELQEAADCLLLFAESAPYELAWHINKLASDPSLRCALTSRAAQYVAAHEWPIVARQMLTIYEAVIQAQPPR